MAKAKAKPAGPPEHPPIEERDWCGHVQYVSPYGDFEHLERSKVIDHMNAVHPLPVIEVEPEIVELVPVDYSGGVPVEGDAA